jgi:hypothetical protein
MAFEKWKTEDGGWNNTVVAVVACCGVLLYVGLYFFLTDDGHKITASNPDNLLTSTTGSGTR